jgi:hypothetical protein
MTSKFRNKQLYTDIFPEFANNLVGTEYAPVQQAIPLPLPPPPPKIQTIKAIKQKFGEVENKKSLYTGITKTQTQRPKLIETQTQTTNNNLDNPIKYDPSLYFPIPKSELDIPLYIPLKMTYPEQMDKYKQKASQYGYFVDTDLTDKNHLVLVNKQKQVVVFGVRGTNTEITSDVLTSASLPFSSLIGKDITSYNRYKEAVKKYEDVKKAYPNDELIRIGHSLGGTIQSVMSKPNETTYTYNRLYGPYDVKPNEIAVSVESDPLFIRKSKDKKKIITIPRTYYEKAKDYVALQKARVDPSFEEKPITIPEEFKTDYENVVYKRFFHETLPWATTFREYIKPNPSIVGLVSPVIKSELLLHAGALGKRAANSHAIENLPLNIRIEPSKKK